MLKFITDSCSFYFSLSLKNKLKFTTGLQIKGFILGLKTCAIKNEDLAEGWARVEGTPGTAGHGFLHR